MAFETTVSNDATTQDTINLIVRTINEEKVRGYAAFVKNELCEFPPPIAYDATGKHIIDAYGKLEFMHRLFEWVCRNVKYQLDQDGVEDVATPAFTIHSGMGDCKKGTIIIAAVLDAAGIPAILKHVYYDGEEEYSHIYVITPNPLVEGAYITLDWTNGCKFDSEVTHSSSTLYNLNGTKMQLRQIGKPQFTDDIGGTCAAMDDTFHNIGANIGANIGRLDLHSFLNRLTQHHNILPQAKIVSEFIKKGMHPNIAVTHALVHDNPELAKRLEHIPLEKQRGAFLQMIQHNTNGMASHLAQVLATNPAALTPVWHMVGGDEATLKAEILKAANIKPISLADLEKKFEGMAGVGKKGWFSHLLHAAAGVLHAIAPIANAIIPGSGAVLGHLADKAESVANSVPVPAPAAPGKLAPPPPLPGVNEDGAGLATASHHGSITLLGMSFLAGLISHKLQIPLIEADALVLVVTAPYIIKLLNLKNTKLWQRLQNTLRVQPTQK